MFQTTKPLKVYAVLSVLKDMHYLALNESVHLCLLVGEDQRIIDSAINSGMAKQGIDPKNYIKGAILLSADISNLVDKYNSSQISPISLTNSLGVENPSAPIKSLVLGLSKEQEKTKSVNEMVCHMRYMLDKVGTEVEKRAVEHIIQRFLKLHNVNEYIHNKSE